MIANKTATPPSGGGQETMGREEDVRRLFACDIDLKDRFHERKVQESEEKYRALFTSAEQGLCIGEVLVDGDGMAVDFKFEEMNAAFEEQMGISNASGLLAREVLSPPEHWLVNICAHAALTGQSNQLDYVQKSSRCWFSLLASRVGGQAFHTPR